MPPWLPHDAILRLHAAVVEARLTVPEQRGLMLRFLDSAFAGTLPILSDSYAQLLSDLQALNTTGTLADGSVPLRRWLEIAITLTEPRNKHVPFAVALARLATPQTASPRPPEPSRAPLPRIVVFAAHLEEGMLRLSEQVKALLTTLQGQISEVDVTNLASESARSLVKPEQLRVVLLGASTGGQRGEALVRELLHEPKHLVVAYLDPLDRARTRHFSEEIPQRELLLAEIEATLTPTAFTMGEEAAATLRDPILRTLEKLAPKEGRDSAVLETWEQTYLDEQAPWWKDGRSDGLGKVYEKCALHREPLYVSLHAWKPNRKTIIRFDEEEFQAEEEQPIFLDEALSSPAIPHAVVVGEAGTGKTVLLQHIAWSLRCHHRGQPLPAECRLDLDALRAERSLVPVPVLIEARFIAAMLAKSSSVRVFERLLEDAFGLQDRSDEVREGLRQGRYLLLVDSLDEVPGIKVREEVVKALSALTLRSGCRVILTTRPTAHTAVTVPRPYERIDIAPLDEDRRQALIARWHAAENLDAEAVRRLPEALSGLSARFPDDGRGQSPLENPLLLTCVLLVYIAQKRLPDNLADLYERMVRHLCDRKPEDARAESDSHRQSPTWRRETLVRVGALLQEQGTTALFVERLCDRLVSEGRFAMTHDAKDALDQLAVTTGLFRFEGQDGVQVVRPWHRSFQEYLAACDLAGRDRTAEDTVRRLWKEGVLTDPGWEGALRFIVGVFGMQGSEKAQGFVGALVALAERAGSDPREGRLLGLAAAGVVEYRKEYFPDAEPAATLRTRIAERFPREEPPRSWVSRLFARFASQPPSGARWPWKDRLLALSALGRLPGGDPRLPDPRTSGEGWVEIPAGTYPIGGDEEAPGTLPQQVSVGRFFLRSWPVAVSEYSVFLQDEPGEEPEDWSAQVHQPNVPVSGVSWHQARAFCRWASGAWRHRPEGTLDLPDSYEWEIAARRPHGGPYPWGREKPGEGDNARANYEWGPDCPGRATPVGMFPLGNAGSLLDMAGNVWEWCASVFGEESDTPCHLSDNECPVDDRSDGAPRVLRGGSWWGHDPGFLRVADRSRFHPGGRLPLVGFRLVVRSPKSAGCPLIFDLRRAASIATFCQVPDTSIRRPTSTGRRTTEQRRQLARAAARAARGGPGAAGGPWDRARCPGE